MTIRGKAFIAGAYEHPRREIPDRSVAQVHAEVALGALADAGLAIDDVDAYFCANDAPGIGPMSMAEYLGLRLSHVDTTETGGSSYLVHVGHAAEAIAAGTCSVALITLAGLPRAARNTARGGTRNAGFLLATPEGSFEAPYGTTTVGMYALAARRHMYEFGTTSEQLAEVKVAASHHAQYNPHALLRNVVTVDEVVESPLVADPLHRLDCCVVTDGGGALVVVSPEVAASFPPLRQGARPRRGPEAHRGRASRPHLHRRGLVGPAGVRRGRRHPGRHRLRLDLRLVHHHRARDHRGPRLLREGQGRHVRARRSLQAPDGRLPFNTDGGGLCNNHPANRGGMTKVIEAVRQLRGEAAPEVQVPDCELALAHGTGGSLGTRMGSATLILGQEDS